MQNINKNFSIFNNQTPTPAPIPPTTAPQQITNIERPSSVKRFEFFGLIYVVLLGLIQVVLNIIALCYIFSPTSNKWFSSKD